MGLGVTLVSLFILIATASTDNVTYSCVCDSATAEQPTGSIGTCKLTINNETDAFYVANCACKDPKSELDFEVDGPDYDVFCIVSTVDDTLIERCSTTLMTDSWANITKYVMWAASIFVIIVVVVVFFMNIIHKNKGHHRYLHLLEEILIVLLFVSMGGLNFLFKDKESPCKIVTIATHFLMVAIAASFLMEGVFAQSQVSFSQKQTAEVYGVCKMVNYKSKKNGTTPVLLNYIIPLILAAFPTAVTYFTRKDEYGITGLHCDSSTRTDTLFGFIIPVWILIFFAGVQAQRGLLFCRKVKDEANEAQVYWGYKTGKILFPMASLLSSIYVLIMFGLDQQVFWIILLAALLTFVFGIYLFIAHTYCHVNTAKAMHPRLFGIYGPCPIDIDEELQKMVDEFLDGDSQRTPSDQRTEAIDLDKDSILGDLEDIKNIDAENKQ